MKETGIIMSGDHPKLILDGIKTMTRRVIVPQPEIKGYFNMRDGELAYYWKGGKTLIRAGYGADYVHTNKDALIEAMLTVCPYGQVGDRLWVKETFDLDGLAPHQRVIYKAENPEWGEYFKWHSPLFMPRWASRILLEITEIRAERVQEITFEDVIVEGLDPFRDCAGVQRPLTEARWLYQELWDSLNAKRGYGWDKNPWVWVISFRQMR